MVYLPQSIDEQKEEVFPFELHKSSRGEGRRGEAIPFKRRQDGYPLELNDETISVPPLLLLFLLLLFRWKIKQGTFLGCISHSSHTDQGAAIA